MAVELSIVSFACAAILVVFLPVKRIRGSVPNLAILLWLGGYNVVHGINAVVWNGNAHTHVPVWCDIVTKLMLGANIALPGAFLCISRHLELVSSSRMISLDKKVIRNRTILDLTLCYAIPILYMSLHVVAQDHRFDLVKNFGCSASIHPSTLRSTDCHLRYLHPSRSPQFLLAICRPRRIAFNDDPLDIRSPAGHNHDHERCPCPHRRSSSDIKVVEMAWWSIFGLSVLYIILVLGLGEETRDLFKWVKEQATRKRELPKFTLPTYNAKTTQVSRSSSLMKPQLRPLTVELKSGWDDMLNVKAPKQKTQTSEKSGSSACSSPTPSDRSVAEDDQAFMNSTLTYLGSPTAKTLGIASPVPAALGSPPRQAMELTIPPRPVSPSPMAPKAKPSIPLIEMPTPMSSNNVLYLASPKPINVDVPSSISSVFEASWPLPPASPTPSLSPSRGGNRSPSHSSPTRSHSRQGSPPSPSPATESFYTDGPASPAPSTTYINPRPAPPVPPSPSPAPSFGYPLGPSITPPYMHSRPFEGSSISSMAEVAAIAGVRVPSPTGIPPHAATRKGSNGSMRSVIMRPSIRSLKRSSSKERLGQGYGQADVIHMTVVQETV
uniref:Pheromone receptor n=2 Tax=Agrocybe salicacicola TaxID=1078488 RepID=A0A2P0M8B5_9AGAR|nr:pheromone receptor [Agrocybe salicacicola]